MSDSIIRVLGCTDQHQFCNLNSVVNITSCTPLTGMKFDSDFASNGSLGLSELQIAIVMRFSSILLATTISQSVISEISLQAYNYLQYYISAPLPNNQWQIEVTTWFNIALTKLQALLIEVSSGPSTRSASSIIQPPFGEHDQALCSAQKVRQNANYNSFSVIGLIIVLAIGGSIIVSSFWIDIFVGYVQRLSHKGVYKSTQWLLDDKLQLQRMIYEKENLGKWDKCDTKVPMTTERIDQMGIIYQLGDQRHPSYGKDHVKISLAPLLEGGLETDETISTTAIEN